MNELFQVQEHLKRISSYSNFKMKTLGVDNLQSEELINITKFKLKFLQLQALDYKDEELLEQVLNLGDKVIDLKNR